MTRRAAVRGVPWLTGGRILLGSRVLQNVNGFILTVILARDYGLAAVGSLTVATIVIAAISLFGTFGLPYVLAKTDLPARQLNRIGQTAAALCLPLSLPVIVAFSAAVGQDRDEALVIGMLCLAGPLFAQTNVAAALQVLQGREAETLIPPVANLAGLALAWWIAPDLLAFAALVALFRFAGVVLAFAILPGGPVPGEQILDAFRRGRRYLAADAVNLGFEQLTVFALAAVLSREALGLVGLCRQFLTVSDTPGWSSMQARYPVLVRDLEAEFPIFLRSMLRLGLALAVAAALAAVPLGLFVFEVPDFAVLGPLLMASVPLRYLVMSLELKLRAGGATDAATALSLAKGAVGLVVVTAGAFVAGAPGAVCGMVAAVAVGWLLSLETVRRSRFDLVARPAERP